MNNTLNCRQDATRFAKLFDTGQVIDLFLV